MKIFLNPSSNNECHVWFNDGNSQKLRGDIKDICIRIRNYVIDNYTDDNGNIVVSTQTKEVYLDTTELGSEYAYILKSLGIEIKYCTNYKLI